QNKLDQIRKLIETAHVSLVSARQLLDQVVGKKVENTGGVIEMAKELGKEETDGSEKIIEGIFDGQNMIGPDGKQYSIPANYASKSKLVVGDTLKLTIKEDGTFLYKQIGPVDRNRLVGVLAKDDITDEYRVVVGEQAFKVLLASVTYFKGDAGDEVVILVPKGKEVEWAAVENIIKTPAGAAKAAVAGEPEGEAKDESPAQEKVEEIDDLT
ncbi:hypothetical protein KKF61_01345, partial [Patescibacteria group bacterium]|nr:hypothetical protein [Patescibacteria group bacterium]